MNEGTKLGILRDTLGFQLYNKPWCKLQGEELIDVERKAQEKLTEWKD